ncbi:MAG TPA: AMP-binding protein, partial [Bryobacteraceae bacterium]|nr:AMP-binding protein [Bryobacteraceae bacterium]
RDTLLDYFADLEQKPGDFAIFHDGARVWRRSYRDIGRASRVFASKLRDAGIAKGDKVLVWSENRPEWLVVLWGCLLEGIVLVPIDYRASFDLVSRIQRMVSGKLIAVGNSVEPRGSEVPLWRLSEWDWNATPSHTDRPEVRGEDLIEIIFTSGATADPKGVLITHRNVLANIVPIEREVQKYLHYAKPFQPIRFLNMLPLSHMFGQSMATFTPPMVNGEVWFLSTFSPDVIVREIHARRISVLVCVPKMLESLRHFVIARFPETADVPKGIHWVKAWWRYRRVHSMFGFKFWAFIVGAAALDPELEEFWRRLGFVVIQGYGLTETAPIVTLNHPFHSRKGTVGKRIGGVQIQVAEDGEVLVRGENVSQGYFGGEGTSTRTLTDGWLHTGDIGELDPDGNLRILGRKKEMIVTPAGLKVFPEDVERVLNEVPGVRESAVVGRDRVHAVLVLEHGASKDEVVRNANSQLEEHQKIKDVSVWTSGLLPRTEGTAKLRRAALLEWAENGRGVLQNTSDTPITALLRKYAPGREITPETTLDELGLSSLDRVELMMELEQKLGTRMEESALSKTSTVADLETAPTAAPAPEPIRYPYWSSTALAALVRWLTLNLLVFPLTRYFVRVRARGREHLRESREPVIFAPTHQSHMDVPVLFLALDSQHRYRVAPAMSQEFFDAHFHPERFKWSEVFTNRLNYFLATLVFRAFPLSRAGAGTREALEYMGSLVSQGVSVLVFPEGRLTEDGRVQAFQPGLALIAAKLHVPVVPVRLIGLDKVLHKDATWPTHGPVEVRFGAPLSIGSDEDYRDFTNRVRDAVVALE